MKQTKLNRVQRLIETFHDAMPFNEMSSYPEKDTGIHNTIFISPKGNAKHAARIKVAVDPPTSLSPFSKSISVQVDDYTVRGDSKISAVLLSKIKKFIDLNRQVILDYWEYKIPTKELSDRLKPIIIENMFEMSNLSPKQTNLPTIVWVSVKGNAKHSPRVKVVTSPGRYKEDDTATVTISDNPELVDGKIDNKYLKPAKEWIILNKDVLIDYWNYKLFTDELIERLKKL